MSSDTTKTVPGTNELHELRRTVQGSGFDAELRVFHGPARNHYMLVIGPELFACGYLVPKERHWLLMDAFMEASDEIDLLARVRRLSVSMESREIELLVGDIPLTVTRPNVTKRCLMVGDGDGRRLLLEKSYLTLIQGARFRREEMDA